MCQNAKFWHTLLSCVRVSKMQGTEIKNKGSAQSLDSSTKCHPNGASKACENLWKFEFSVEVFYYQRDYTDYTVLLCRTWNQWNLLRFFYQRDCTDYTVLLCRTSNLCNQLRFYYQLYYPDGASKARESLWKSLKSFRFANEKNKRLSAYLCKKLTKGERWTIVKSSYRTIHRNSPLLLSVERKSQLYL